MNVKSGFKQRLRSQRLIKWKDSHLIHFSIKQYLREIITKSTCWEIHFKTFHYHKIDQIGRDVRSSFSPAFCGKGSQEGIMQEPAQSYLKNIQRWGLCHDHAEVVPGNDYSHCKNFLLYRDETFSGVNCPFPLSFSTWLLMQRQSVLFVVTQEQLLE